MHTFRLKEVETQKFICAICGEQAAGMLRISDPADPIDQELEVCFLCDGVECHFTAMFYSCKKLVGEKK